MAVTNPSYSCPVCDQTNHDIPFDEFICHKGHLIGSVNVRLAKRAEEHNELEARYQNALTEAEQNGLKTEILAFSEEVEKNSAVVFNMQIGPARKLFLDNNETYKNYYEQINSKNRPRTSMEKTRNRNIVDGWLFPDFGHAIRHGALTLNNRGPLCYGPVSVIIDDADFLKKYASTLEENSYHFAKKYCFTLPDDEEMAFSEPPLGYRSDWENRYKIAVAKHKTDLTSGSDINDFCNVLLQTGKNRAEEEFIEIHLYKTFNAEQIKEVTYCKTKIDSEDHDIVDMMVVEIEDRHQLACEAYD